MSAPLSPTEAEFARLDLRIDCLTELYKRLERRVEVVEIYLKQGNFPPGVQWPGGTVAVGDLDNE